MVDQIQSVCWFTTSTAGKNVSSNITISLTYTYAKKVECICVIAQCLHIVGMGRTFHRLNEAE